MDQRAYGVEVPCCTDRLSLMAGTYGNQASAQAKVPARGNGRERDRDSSAQLRWPTLSHGGDNLTVIGCPGAGNRSSWTQD